MTVRSCRSRRSSSRRRRCCRRHSRRRRSSGHASRRWRPQEAWRRAWGLWGTGA